MKHLLYTLLIWACVCCCAQKDKGTITVYTTHTGKKYHSSSCLYLAKSSIPVSLHDAVNSGYRPCGECNPPAYYLQDSSITNNMIDDTLTVPQTGQVTNETNANLTGESEHVSARCTGVTKKGKQCKRMTTNSSGRCFQHESK